MKRYAAYMVSIAVTISFIIGAWVFQAQAQPASSAEAGSAGLELLLPLSEQAIGDGEHIILKHTSPYKTYRTENEFLSIGQELSRKLGLPESHEILAEQDHLLYKAEAAMQEGTQVTLLWVGYSDGTSSMIVTAQTGEGFSGPTTQQAMMRLQQELSGTLQSLGLAPEWNVMIQGTLSDTFADTAQDPLSVYRWLTEELQLKEVGKYQDTGSTSISYYSPLLPAFTPDPEAPASRMNFQVAVHRNSMTKEQRLTIATPAISIEY